MCTREIDNRYYSNAYGRFMTPDPYMGSVRLTSPQSWNRYSYVGGDPVNGSDPSGLCDAVVSGITEGPGSDSGEGAFAGSEGAMIGYPYAGTNVATGVGAVAANALDLNTTSAYTALSEILSAANDSSGPINITTFSGGAQAFADALAFLPSSVTSRIASITYVSPGSPGGLPTVNGVTPTVILGTGAVDSAATASTPIPSNYNVIQTTCGHDFACEMQQAQQMGWMAPKGNPCNQPATFVPDINSAMQWVQSIISPFLQAAWAATPYVGPGTPLGIWIPNFPGPDEGPVTSCWTDTNGVEHCS